MDIETLSNEIGRAMPGILASTRTPGAVVALAGVDGRVIEQGYGVADVAAEVPMMTGHTFQGGSVGKLLIAVAAMRMVEARRLDLHAPIGLHLDFDLVNPLGEREITPFDLLTHASGMTTDSIEPEQVNRRRDPRASLAVALVGGRAPEYHGARSRWAAPVGAAFWYSTTGMEVVAQGGGWPGELPFSRFADEEICGPLGMLDTAWPGSRSWFQASSSLARGHMRFGDWTVPSPHIGTRAQAAAGIVTTAGDQTRLLAGLLRDEATGRHELLSPESVAELRKSRRPYLLFGKPSNLAIGLGFQIRDAGAKRESFGHMSSYPFGWWLVSWAYPALGFAVTVGINSWDMSRYFNPPHRTPCGIVVEMAADLMESGAVSARDQTPRRRSRETDRDDIAGGMVVAERFGGLLSSPEVFTEEAIRAMVIGARSLRKTRQRWSGREFAAGLRAMLPHTGSPEAIRSVLASGEAGMSAADLGRAVVRWGASEQASPMPVEFYAGGK